MSNPTVKAYERRRSAAKELVRKHHSAKEARKKHEEEFKERLTGIGGTMWGYDPMAGRIAIEHSSPNVQHGMHGCYVFRGSRHDSDEYGVDEIDILGRRTGRKWLHGSKWGVESGGPGREPPLQCNHVEIGLEDGGPDLLRRGRSQRTSRSPRTSPRRPGC